MSVTPQKGQTSKANNIMEILIKSYWQRAEKIFEVELSIRTLPTTILSFKYFLKLLLIPKLLSVLSLIHTIISKATHKQECVNYQLANPGLTPIQGRD